MVMTAQELTDRVAVVTGGASGLGAETAELLVARGARVMIAGRRAQQGAATAARLGPSVDFRQFDVAEEAQVKGLIE